MLNLVVRWVLLALAIIFTAWAVPGIEITGFMAAMVAAVVIGLINLFIRPIILFLSIPINLVTLGMFTLVINAFMLMLTSFFTPGFEVQGFLAALLGSLLLSALSVIINWAAGELQPA